MRRFLILLGALLLLPLVGVQPSASAAAWSGPQTSITNKNGRQVLKLCDTGGACRTSTPFFLALNSRTHYTEQGDWSRFNYEEQLHAAHTASPDMDIAPMLQVHLYSTYDGFIDDLANRLNQYNPRPYLMIRMHLEGAPFGAELTKMQDLQGNVVDDTGGFGHQWTLSDAWLAHQEQELTRILTRFDTRYPNRVMGLLLTYQLDGEWFYRPYGYTGGTMRGMGDPDLCATAGGQQTCGLYPWTNDAGTQPGPRGRHSFYLDDYSASAQAGFCSWSGLPASLQPNCRAATTTERNNAVPGQSPPASGLARGAILDPADLNSLRAAKYNQYLGVRISSAISRLLGKAKQITNGRILTTAFYGYLYGLDSSLPASGHTGLSTLLSSPNVDMIGGPYSYYDSRELTGGYASQSAPEAVRLAGKLWLDEDDTRTYLRCVPNCVYDANALQTVTNLWDSIRVLRRNLLMGALAGRASHFLDLRGDGWFGRPDYPAESDAQWGNMQPVFRAINTIQHGGANAYRPQVAVFVDDLSPNYQPALTAAGEHSYYYGRELSTFTEDMARLGTPVRHLLLSDLTKANLDLSAVKLAVLPNAYAVPSAIRTAIDTKLKTPGRTILTVHAAGYIRDDQAASTSTMTSLTGITITRGTGTPALTQTYPIVGQTGGPGYPLTPWFTVTDPASTTMGSYLAGGVSLASKAIAVSGGTYTSVYAAAPKLPLSVLRKISENAGVHHFAPAGDSVEAAGNMVVLHAGTSGTRTLNLPQSMPQVYETALYPNDIQLCTNCGQLTGITVNYGDTRAFRWTSVPRGNIDVATGTTFEGWAGDLDQPATSSRVAVYLGGPIGVGTPAGEYPTTLNRTDVNNYFGITGVHGFRFTLAGCAPGTSVYIYALDLTGDPAASLGSRTCT